MHLYNLISLIPGSIFTGTLIMAPCVLIIHWFKISLSKISKPVLIQTINIVLLLASVWYTLTWLTKLYIAFFSGGDYEQYAFTNRYAGPFWYYALTRIMNYLLLPQLLWFKRFRNSVVSLGVIWSVWIIGWSIDVFITYNNYESLGIITGYSGFDFLRSILIYMAIVAITYLILNRKAARFKEAI